MTALDRLAALAGVEPGYHDIWGTYFEIAPPVKIAILEAMGIPAADDAAQATSLDRLETAPWRRLAGPVTIVPAEAQPGAVTLYAPAGGESVLQWSIDLETPGPTSKGSMTWNTLPLEGQRQVDGVAYERRRLSLPTDLPEGYHRLAVTLDGETLRAETLLIVAPPRCWGIDEAARGRRLWGLSCQLYSLRSSEDWGLGGFGELNALARRAGAEGASVVGLNPLHAMFPADPGQASPYSPASRDYLNGLYIDVAAVPDLDGSADAKAMIADPDFQDRLAAARATDLIDYAAVAALKMPVLEAVWRDFQDRHRGGDSDRARAFAAFRQAHGQALRRFAVFLALQEHFAADDPSRLAWWNWPEAYHDPRSKAVEDFVRDHEARVGFHEYLQWLADEQLRMAADEGTRSGLVLGLYRDLAVGVGPASAAAWASPEALVSDLSVGGPPDLLAPQGQNWGLSPLHPVALRDRAFTPFIAALRSNMRHAGALRIDHVMGLMHLFVIPPGVAAGQGAYLAYPFDDMLRVLALESRRHRCVVIGEDLGTVPEGFRPWMMDAGILSYRVLMFERVGDGLFASPETYPEQALVTAGTHDLATLAGFWTGRDIEWRRDVGIYPDAQSAAADTANRAADRRRLIDALIAAGVWPAEPPTDSERQPMDRALLIAIHRYLAKTPSRLLIVQAEDMAGQREQMNLPGTIDSHPNWRRRLDRTVDALIDDPDAAALMAALRADRPGA
ncbi:MAG: 4-alpha-glucanotransferase [Inquilinaceae bacterium]